MNKPHTTELYPSDYLVLLFIEKLSLNGFTGHWSHREIDRISVATDNSIYQLLPQIILYPKVEQDLCIALKLLASPMFGKFAITAKGGGTSTNGQSLTASVVIDFSRHMNKIQQLDLENQTVVVEPGVVLAELNEFLAQHDLFFPPMVSTANRATIGGMMATDASGKGSKHFGKTGQHVVSCHFVDSHGKVHQVEPCLQSKLEQLTEKDPWLGKIMQSLLDMRQSRTKVIEKRWPKVSRSFSGYNIKDYLQETSNGLQCNLIPVLAGSEGTLGLVSTMKLQLVRKHKYSMVAVLGYENFAEALTSAQALIPLEPYAIETMDERVIEWSKLDPSYQHLESLLPFERPLRQAMNFVEFVSHDKTSLQQKKEELEVFFAGQSVAQTPAYTLLFDAKDIRSVWHFRSRSVGILSAHQGEKKAIPFVEDCCVPVETLTDFVQDFKNLLDKQGYAYAMFGHADAGVIHVRPLLNLETEEDRQALRLVSDAVAKLVRKYKGVFWGEHGKGFRSEYLLDSLGSLLFDDMRQIKTWFDPDNRFNPGKLYIPYNSDFDLIKLDEVFLKAQRDQEVSAENRQTFAGAFLCDGNAECLSVLQSDLMCPSYRLDRDIVHSPKGRSMILREWLAHLTKIGVTLTPESLDNPYKKRDKSAGHIQPDPVFTEAVKESLDGCLSCKACSHVCPARVDITEYRSLFYSYYYQHNARPKSDKILFSLEQIIPKVAKTSWLTNRIFASQFLQPKLEQNLGLVNMPPIAKPGLAKLFRQHKVALQTVSKINKNKAPENKAVILLPDLFLYYFEPQALLESYKILLQFGYQPYMAKFKPNGKGLHVKGYRAAFKKTAQAQADYINSLAQANAPILSLEPSITLAYREEYQKFGFTLNRPVLSLEEFVLAEADRADSPLQQYQQAYVQKNQTSKFAFLSHCSERSAIADVQEKWAKIFQFFGAQLATPKLGCCGMAGIFGHEKENQQKSAKIFQQGWASSCQQLKNQGFELLASGYSCREQVRIQTKFAVSHPAHGLLTITQ